MAKICLCLTGETLAGNLEVLDKYRKYVDVAELRVDFLDPDERFFIRSFPEQAGLPVILTIRRTIDGGRFNNGEGSRVTLLSRGLAFAEEDRRKNFAYVDLEEDLDVPGLEEAARTFGTRIIRSFHDLKGVNNITERIRSLRRVGDEIVKAAVMPQSLEDVQKVYRAAKENGDMEKILLCMGPFGYSTRILADYMGSYLSYTTPRGENMPSAAPGQMDPRELVELYRFREINARTKIVGIVGFPLKTTYSPLIFNTVFSHEKIDAVYVPFPASRLEHFLSLAEELKAAGVSVTIPYKEAVIPYLGSSSETVKAVGACNTIVFDGTAWNGYNTDTYGFSESLLTFIGRRHLRGLKITVLGAGGAARAAAAEIYRLKGNCLILNRSAPRARELALPYQFKWGGLDAQGLDIMEKYSDIIVQTTPVGTFPNVDDDPLESYHFKGREMVMDMIYNPEKTAFLRRAEAAGCAVLNGFDMLIRQAKHQFQFFFRRDFPDQLIPRLNQYYKRGLS
ncbi:MAG: shikimate dehydrogenase [Treponema sp.]|jgi:3-dehydroquinate dehydratase/shikimate dehydrogenase|nr:shikimate dehydrogenase [Treponema sp.]